MDLRPRFFASRLTRTERRVYGAVTVFFIAAFLATLWPVYEWAGGALPLVFGLPFDLFYLAVILVGSFFVLLGLFVWEGRREARDGRSGDPGGDAPAATRSGEG